NMYCPRRRSTMRPALTSTSMWWETVPFETPASLQSSWHEYSASLPMDSSSATRRGSDRALLIVRNWWRVRAGRGFVAKFDAHQTSTGPGLLHGGATRPAGGPIGMARGAGTAARHPRERQLTVTWPSVIGKRGRFGWVVQAAATPMNEKLI